MYEEEMFPKLNNDIEFKLVINLITTPSSSSHWSEYASLTKKLKRTRHEGM